MARVVLAMSGGVDSSVAAHLLLEAGHDVIGVFMRHGRQSPAACASKEEGGRGKGEGRGNMAALPVVSRLDHKQGCCTAADAEDGRRVADRLGIPFYALDLNQEFGRIIDYFVDEYTAGRTPNPCVQCNNWIKFGKLFNYADGIGAEYVATGHYARMATGASGHPAILRGRDGAKDQSYVLFGVRRELLARMLLPVGDYEKPAIRRIAASLGLDVAAKKDSQEICFVTQGRYDDFIRSYRGSRSPAAAGEAASTAGVPRTQSSAGDFVLTDGTIVGRHAGLEAFTVGQRKGLGIALGEPKFVVRLEPGSRRVVLGDREELGRDELTASSCNWLIDEAVVPDRLLVQVRYNSRPAAATGLIATDGRLHVRFDEPQYNVAPGQAVVCYNGERVMGGGWID